jgi:ethanolamine utilization protein EutA (predicted chaperonin)
MFGGIYIIFIAFGAGWLVVWTVKKAINNRRSPLLKIVMSITAFLASLYPIISLIIITNQEIGYALGRGYFSLIWYLVYSVIISSNVYFQLRK